MNIIRVPLAPPDAQLLAALKPRVDQHVADIVIRLTAAQRGGKLTTEQLWSAVGGLVALQDLQMSLDRSLKYGEPE